MLKKLRLPHYFFYILVAVYIAAALLITAQELILQRKTEPGQIPAYTKYNNYVIFQRSHFHLLQGENLYREYPAEQIDLFKYSPTFAFFFGALAYFPDWLGLALWNLLNILVFLFAIWYLPFFDLKMKAFLLALSGADVFTSLQNSQSNVLIAGLLILSFGLLEKNRYFPAVLCIMATFYIKIFGIIAILLFLFYPGRLKLLTYTVISFLVLAIVPMPVIGFDQLRTAYLQYFDLLRMDEAASIGLSVMGWMKTWFHLEISNFIIVAAGFVLLCMPLLRLWKVGDYPFRLHFLSALMIWMIIFNHKAESAGFIIATSGIFIWFLSTRASAANVLLLCMVVLFTSLSSTDIFPEALRDNYLVPYVVKVIPCILVWGKILADLLWGNFNEEKGNNPENDVGYPYGDQGR